MNTRKEAGAVGDPGEDGKPRSNRSSDTSATSRKVHVVHNPYKTKPKTARVHVPVQPKAKAQAQTRKRPLSAVKVKGISKQRVRLQAGLLLDQDDTADQNPRPPADVVQSFTLDHPLETVGNPDLGLKFIQSQAKNGNGVMTLYHDLDFGAAPGSIEGTQQTEKVVKCW